MPFESLGQLSDVDAQALYLYLNAPAGSVKVDPMSAPATHLKSSVHQIPLVNAGLRLPG